jgi:peroxidase
MGGLPFYDWGLGFHDRLNIGLPNERTLSNHLYYLEDEPINKDNISLAEVFFGQFLNHDQEQNVEDHNRKYSIALEEPNDQFLDAHPGLTSVNMSYSTLYNASVPFSYMNQQTSYLDLSTVYGFTDAMVDALRSHVDGKLLSNDYESCTYNGVPYPFGNGTCTNDTFKIFNLPASEATTGLPNALGFNEFGQDRNFLLSCGDQRCNENAALSLMQIGFFREHNRLATMLKDNGFSTDDEILFQEARRINIAIYQHIIYEEYLPAIIGKEYSKQILPAYDGYNSSLNPATSHVFAAAAFRYGHSSLRDYRCFDVNGCTVDCVPSWTPAFWRFPQGVMPILGSLGPTAFTVPELYNNAGGMSNVIYSLVYQLAGSIDNVIDNTFRNLGKGFVPLDISAADIARGRINGLPDYHLIREFFYKPIYGEPDCTYYPDTNVTDSLSCFLHITSNTTHAQQLLDFYGRLDRIDPIVGMFFEDHESDCPMGPTMAHVIVQEYDRKRKADRFYYENQSFDLDTLYMIGNRTMVDFMNDNFGTSITSFFHIMENPQCPPVTTTVETTLPMETQATSGSRILLVFLSTIMLLVFL